ncbi:hypothetical protein FQN54_003778 [Arachnomyces sp. PD_36]|nr:hypothetical protein FQN54_003778 [Arachnomyces sp. PD_36]
MEGFWKLPIELLPEIVRHLPHEDLKNARLISKNFYAAVERCGFFHHVSFRFLRAEDRIPLAISTFTAVPEPFRRVALKDKETLCGIFGGYQRIVQQLLIHRGIRPRDWLQHITVRADTLLPLGETLVLFKLNHFSKLTVFLDMSVFGSVTVERFLWGMSLSHLEPFVCVKELCIDVRDILDGEFSRSFLFLITFSDMKTPNLERLTIKTSIKYHALPDTHPLIYHSRYALHTERPWDNLHTIHLTGLMLERFSLSYFILKQPRLEYVLLEKVNLTSAERIAPRFNGSAWVWFFTDVGGRFDTPAHSHLFPSDVHPELIPREDVWAKMKFFVDQLCTGAVMEDIDSWDFPHVKKLSEYVPN